MLKRSAGFIVFLTVLLCAVTVLAESPQPAGTVSAPSQCSITPASTVVPLGTTNCGTYTCANDGNCCGSSTCCPSNMGFYCRSKNMCYSSEADARRACGNGYTICNKPVR